MEELGDVDDGRHSPGIEEWKDVIGGSKMDGVGTADVILSSAFAVCYTPPFTSDDLFYQEQGEVIEEGFLWSLEDPQCN